ncbi:FGGY-family carbohydrate kinase [Kineococcus indalonis]|uniref:FGGY-family carbohydrate kinase n=1 Tax=Kineococcus indalonis TaxID=2696566 RepID=UPI001412C54D|nr:FGGY family carbohydrate kinase [Kineococcus indalonis]NAZ85323.1 sugar kinase [Kineococcus indalonis]
MQGTTELLLGVDVGTGSSKGVLVTLDGRVVARASRSHRTDQPGPGRVEHDADAVWWADLTAIARELTARAGDPHDPAAGRVVAVCASGIGPTALLADAGGAPLHPAILYGVDTRALAEAAELEERYGTEDLLQRCGSRMSSQAAGAKLLWLRRHRPELFARARYFFMANSYLVFRLTGEHVLDHHSASQTTPLYDRRTASWIPERWEEVAPGLPAPRLVWPSERVGTVTARAAESTGIPAGTPVAAGTIDAWAEAESVDVGAPGDLMVMYGTTTFFVAVTDGPRSHPALWGTAGVRPGQSTLAAGTAATGAAAEWWREAAGRPDVADLVAEAAAAPPGANGLLALPYFAGERTPFADADARGALLGLTLRSTRGEVHRALLEATAFSVRHDLEAIESADVPVRRVVGVGGGTASRLWPQIVSDATGRAQELPAERIGASYGDAKLAAVALGALDVDATWNSVGTLTEPDERAGAVYAELYPAYRRLHEATADLQHLLSAVERRSRG